MKRTMMNKKREKEKISLNIMGAVGGRLKREFKELRGRGARFFTQSLCSWKKAAGFTLVELVIVVVIGVILSVGGFLVFSSYKNRKDLEFSLDEIFAVVKQTQSRAVTQEGGKAWGVRFVSSSTGADSYEIFHGNSYSSSSVESSRGFRRPVEFGEPSGGRTVDLDFGARTGEIDNKKVISIVHENDLDKAGDIVINTLGKATARMEDDIVGYWHFDEGTGTSTLDSSGNSNTGVASGTTWTAAASCKAGQCLDFDGTDDYVEISEELISEQSQLTYSVWVNADKIDGSWRAAIASDDGTTGPLRLYVDASGAAGRVTLYGGKPDLQEVIVQIDAADAISENQWYHIVGVLDGTDAHIYIDGELKKSAAWNKSVDMGRGIGALQNDDAGEAHYFSGRIDEVRIYDTVLSSSTIKAHYEDLK